MNSKQVVTECILVAAMLLLGGCATAPGNLNGYSTEADSLPMVFVYKDVIRNGVITEYEIKQMRETGVMCGAQIGEQVSSSAETMATSALQYGVPGAVGLEQGAKYINYAQPSQYFWYGFWASTFNGVAAGTSSWSYANVSAVGTCMNQLLSDRAATDTALHIHVTVAFVRSRLPGLIEGRGQLSEGDMKAATKNLFGGPAPQQSTSNSKAK